MTTIPFDVNNGEVRSAFFRHLLCDAMATLQDGSQPRWGRMTAQQMVEHLAWTFEVSTGKAHVECSVPERRRDRMKAFLYDNKPMLREFMNPALVAGLPPLRTAGLAEARTVLMVEADRFLELCRATPDVMHTHPVFGPIGTEEWARSHFKHGYHHLVQFGLVEEGGAAPGE